MKILLVDQFSDTPTPYELSLRPMKFDEFVAQELARPSEANARALLRTSTQLLDVDEKEFKMPMCTTAFRAAEDGTVEVWRYRWDSSG